VKNIEVLSFDVRDAEISAIIWAKFSDNGCEVNDADIMISAISMREDERLLTMDRDFDLIKAVAELDVEIIEEGK
jgi:predicted nucleic acid-binding protein